jgi:DMSO/TMAO reductase YedYZ molybdopterin-dependent catalytic subunit
MSESDSKKGEIRKPVPSATEFPLLKDDTVAAVGQTHAESGSPPATDSLAAAGTRTAEVSGSATSEDKRIAVPRGPHSGAEFAEAPSPVILVPRRSLQFQSRRDFLVYGAGMAALATGFWWLLPPEAQARLRGQSAVPTTSKAKTKFLTGILAFDDDVAEALYSPSRRVPTYSKADVTPNLRNNYDGQTPDPSYIPTWTLTLTGLASGRKEELEIGTLLGRFAHHDQITRLCCVEGWSAIAWWGGLRFADLLTAYPPASDARWASLTSSVNLDGDGNSDPYYVSIDLSTAQHPQTLLATHQNGKPLDVGHGAPLRLVAPMKLGLKNIKAVTSIAYTVGEPADYWNEQGYSRYDGV